MNTPSSEQTYPTLGYVIVPSRVCHAHIYIYIQYVFTVFPMIPLMVDSPCNQASVIAWVCIQARTALASRENCSILAKKITATGGRDGMNITFEKKSKKQDLFNLFLVKLLGFDCWLSL